MRICIRTEREAYPVVEMWQYAEADASDDDGSHEVPDEMWQAYRQARQALRAAEQAILDHCGIQGGPSEIGYDDGDD